MKNLTNVSENELYVKLTIDHSTLVALRMLAVSPWHSIRCYGWFLHCVTPGGVLSQYDACVIHFPSVVKRKLAAGSLCPSISSSCSFTSWKNSNILNTEMFPGTIKIFTILHFFCVYPFYFHSYGYSYHLGCSLRVLQTIPLHSHCRGTHAPCQSNFFSISYSLGKIWPK